MNNAEQMESVMHKAHKEGIVQEIHDEAISIRKENDSNRVDFYESYIMAYDSLKKKEL